jgi:hypothetical protein
MEGAPYSWIGRINIVKISILLKAKDRLNVILIKILILFKNKCIKLMWNLRRL